MLDLATIESDLAECIADLPVVCVFNGESFTATSSETNLATRDLEVDGETIPVDRSVVALLSALPAALQHESMITVGGTLYRVQGLVKHQDGKGVEIMLKDPTR